MTAERPSLPLLVIVRRYACPFCSRSRSKKAATAAHIARCWYNPGARGCKTCRHFVPESDACGCDAGCNWGASGPDPEHCAAGCDITGGLVTGCPKWEVA